jgi:tripartite-type tricarboxylate transporter receptor subunit TctC
MKRMKLGLVAALGVAVFSAGAGVNPAAADAIEDFYKGKQMRVIVGYPPGGGFDAYARMLADYLPRHIAGNPTVIVQHMPGAASVKAAHFIYAVGPQDGTVLGLLNHAVPLNALVWKDVGEGFDTGKFNWIGRLDLIDLVGITWHETGVTSVEQAKQKELIFGATSPTGTSVMTPVALNKLVGTKFKLVQGYNGTADQYLAMERGEIQGMGNAIWSQLKRSHPLWLEQKKITPIFQDGYERHPDLPDVPNVTELATNEEDRKVLRLLASTSVVGRAFLAGPKVPTERVVALRKAFDAMAADAAFKAEMDKRSIPLNPMTGEKLQAMLAEISAYPESLFERTRQVVK